MKLQSLERHPLCAEYGDVNGRVFERMVEVLKERGIANERAVTVYEGKVLDGWQLLRTCLAAGIEPTTQDLPKGWTAEDWVEMSNDLRRHESQAEAEQRIKVRRERIRDAREKGKSTRAIAADEGISKSQVQRDLADIIDESSGVPRGTPDNAKSAKSEQKKVKNTPKPPSKVTGLDGKTYPATNGRLCPSCQRRVRVLQPLPKNCAECKALQEAASEQQTMEEKIKGINSAIEHFCRGLMQFVDDNLPEDAWLAVDNVREGAIRKFRDGCEMLRAKKCVAVCPKCKGEPSDTKCRPCHGTGRVPKHTMDMMV